MKRTTKPPATTRVPEPDAMQWLARWANVVAILTTLDVEVQDLERMAASGPASLVPLGINREKAREFALQMETLAGDALLMPFRGSLDFDVIPAKT